jgi:hypothetical protein
VSQTGVVRAWLGRHGGGSCVRHRCARRNTADFNSKRPRRIEAQAHDSRPAADHGWVNDEGIPPVHVS